MKNLGKIVAVWLLILNSLFALDLNVSPSAVYEGDQVTVQVSAHGDEVKFPRLENLAGYKVESQSISRNITNINGNITKTLTKSYIITPRNDFTIEPIEVEIDGKKEKTQSFEVAVNKANPGNGAPFIFTLEADKKEVYMGEPVNITFTFKKHIDVELAEANFNSPTFHDFWAKPTEKEPSTLDGDYVVYKIRYLLFPQKSGKINIESARMDAGMMQKRTRDLFSFERVKWKSVFSNELSIDVKPLPAGVNIYGNFELNAEIDKNSTKLNEPVNLTISLKGVGNIDDIEDFKLEIPNALVYADKPQKKIYTNNTNELGKFTQKFAIVSDRNFTIPSLSFTFFDSNEKKTRTLTTPTYEIAVEGGIVRTQTAKLEKKTTDTDTAEPQVIYSEVSKSQLVLYAFGGFLAGIALSFLVFMIQRPKQHTKDHETPLITKLKKSKSNKELLSHLLPYAHNSQMMRQFVAELEENIYEGASHRIDKKKLLAELESFLQETPTQHEILQ